MGRAIIILLLRRILKAGHRFGSECAILMNKQNVKLAKEISYIAGPCNTNLVILESIREIKILDDFYSYQHYGIVTDGFSCKLTVTGG